MYKLYVGHSATNDTHHYIGCLNVHLTSHALIYIYSTFDISVTSSIGSNAAEVCNALLDVLRPSGVIEGQVGVGGSEEGAGQTAEEKKGGGGKIQSDT